MGYSDMGINKDDVRTGVILTALSTLGTDSLTSDRDADTGFTNKLESEEPMAGLLELMDGVIK